MWEGWPVIIVGVLSITLLMAGLVPAGVAKTALCRPVPPSSNICRASRGRMARSIWGRGSRISAGPMLFWPPGRRLSPLAIINIRRCAVCRNCARQWQILTRGTAPPDIETLRIHESVAEVAVRKPNLEEIFTAYMQ